MQLSSGAATPYRTRQYDVGPSVLHPLPKGRSPLSEADTSAFHRVLHIPGMQQLSVNKPHKRDPRGLFHLLGFPRNAIIISLITYHKLFTYPKTSTTSGNGSGGGALLEEASHFLLKEGGEKRENALLTKKKNSPHYKLSQVPVL